MRISIQRESSVKKGQETEKLFAGAARRRAARIRKLTRGLRAIVAILIAVFAGLFLVACGSQTSTGKNDKPSEPQKTGEKEDGAAKADQQKLEEGKGNKKSKVDKEEHRKGMPVRDFIVE
ncbi:MAG: hypothetical protein QF473_22440 [Planctomycetota bacterium]|jgi:hypothetical protein|nr:hypothetical protein [Planctomycetota bacterium]MDP6505030.1 hypothetical protein [Planctomycetota bacterium]